MIWYCCTCYWYTGTTNSMHHTSAVAAELQGIWCVEVHSGHIAVRSAQDKYEGFTVRVNLGRVDCDCIALRSALHLHFLFQLMPGHVHHWQHQMLIGVCNKVCDIYQADKGPHLVKHAAVLCCAMTWPCKAAQLSLCTCIVEASSCKAAQRCTC